MSHVVRPWLPLWDWPLVEASRAIAALALWGSGPAFAALEVWITRTVPGSSAAVARSPSETPARTIPVPELSWSACRNRTVSNPSMKTLVNPRV